MSGGGKGGSRQTSTSIPAWVQAPAERNIARAEVAQKVGYMPFYGPDVAAFNPTQQAAFNSNISAAEAFGMVPQGSLTAMQGMAPTPNTYAGGLQAYSSGALFDQALAELKARRPGQVAQYDRLFVDPFSGDQPSPLTPDKPNIIPLKQSVHSTIGNPMSNPLFGKHFEAPPEGYVSMGNGYAIYKG